MGYSPLRQRGARGDFKVGRVFLLLLLLSVFACTSSSPTISPLSEDAVVLAFGNSLTFGNGAEMPGNAYPAVLSRLIGRRVINAGNPGEITAKGLERLPGAIEQINLTE